MENLQIDKIAVIDFGGPYNDLVVRRIRELNVYSEIFMAGKTPEALVREGYKGIILTGSFGDSEKRQECKALEEYLTAPVPVLAIGQTAERAVEVLGGQVERSGEVQYGRVEITTDKASARLFQSIPSPLLCQTDRNSAICKVPEGFRETSHELDGRILSCEDTERGIYAVHFRPELSETSFGLEILKNFVREICDCSAQWKPEAFEAYIIGKLREKIKEGRALCALSGGVDSAVSARLVFRAIGDQLTCVFVDTGLLRLGEGDRVEASFAPLKEEGMHFVRVNAQEQFYKILKGLRDPWEKRLAIEKQFQRIFREEARKIGKVDYLIEGTIYPDIIEKMRLKDGSKTHPRHNVRQYMSQTEFRDVISPLERLFKSEVRKVGLDLGMARESAMRQKFPSAGLGVRIAGEVTPEKIRIVQEADAIFRQEMEHARMDREVAQYFAALTDTKTAGSGEGGQTYEYAVALRAITTPDYMTAKPAELPYKLIGRVVDRILTEIPHVNRVFYDVTGKPPANIELE